MKYKFSGSLKKTFLTAFLALIMLAVGLHFLLDEGVQFAQVKQVLQTSDRRWLFLGVALSVGYVLLHSEMYFHSFKALGLTVSKTAMTRLYLKRTFVSVFLPAGFVASQAFFSTETANSEQVDEHDVHTASGIFTIAGFLSMIIVVIPALGWLVTQQILPAGAVEAFLVLTVLLSALLAGLVSFARKGKVYVWAENFSPKFTAVFNKLDWQRFSVRHFLYVVLFSCVVEAVGVYHIFIAAKTLGAGVDFTMAFAGYMAVLVVLMTSPFLRGVGAVEALLAFVLMHFGMEPVLAVSTAVLFRFFEFWLMLVMAVPVFFIKPGSLMLRLLPSILLFTTGVVSIISALTPSVTDRVKLLVDYLPLEAIHASTSLTLTVGFILMGTSFYLLRGLRNAWIVALATSVIALFSHITKGFDYEESVLALITIGVLLYQRGEYTVNSDMKIIRKGWIPAVIIAKTVLVLGTLGFWMLDKLHFGTDFTWQQSAGYAFQTFFLMTPDNLHPLTAFGADFLGMLQILGGLAMLFLFFAVLRPYFPRFENETDAREKAIGLVNAHGRSALDYFKTYNDKLYFFPKNDQSFIAYKNTASYALALENPVAPNDSAMRDSVVEFDAFCRQKGLRSIYYRIPESSAPLYRSMGKSLLPLGQEAIVNLTTFTLEGKDKKSIRNGLHKMEREGYQFVVHPAPLNGRLLQQLKAVSDDWLKMLHRGELTFSQGVFDESEIKQQTVATMEDSDGKIIAFVNFIPGGSPTEANFDLMRRINEAPNGTMDFLFANMFTYLKSAGYTTCNLGMVPMAGLQHPTNLPENIIKLAYERLPRFAGFKSLRFFKEKFDPVWETKYVAYDSQLDLINLPAALGKVVNNQYPPEKRGFTSRRALPSQ